MEGGQQTHLDRAITLICMGLPIIAFGVYLIPLAMPSASIFTD